MSESLTQSLAAGVQITLHREKPDSLRNVPRSLNIHVPECWPDKDRILTKSGQDVVPYGVRGWHALPRVPPVRTRSHALSLRVCFRLPFGKVPSMCEVPSTFIFLYCFELPRQPFAQKQ